MLQHWVLAEVILCFVGPALDLVLLRAIGDSWRVYCRVLEAMMPPASGRGSVVNGTPRGGVCWRMICLGMLMFLNALAKNARSSVPMCHITGTLNTPAWRGGWWGGVWWGMVWIGCHRWRQHLQARARMIATRMMPAAMASWSERSSIILWWSSTVTSLASSTGVDVDDPIVQLLKDRTAKLR